MTLTSTARLRSGQPYTSPDADPSAQPTPSLRRRLAAMLYEGVVLFGVLMVAGLIFSPLVGQHHALEYRLGLQVVLFILLGAYFAWFWSHGGQTVAMKTWHVRLVRADGQPVSLVQALARYVLSWLWFVPALLAISVLHLPIGSGSVSAVLLAGVLVYALWSHLLPDNQFMHDRLCKTRLITWRPAPKRR
ncbi:MAG: hypothetical protein RLY71_1270 [Pseudomonadota bacterium]|jgi:uncharacterized RDD family membrane protein YckC